MTLPDESEPVSNADNTTDSTNRVTGVDAEAAEPGTSLKHHLLGPSVTKSGQDGVDLKKVSEIIYEASKGSKFFNNEQAKDKNLTAKIGNILKLKAQLDKIDLKHDLRRADDYLAELELSRDLSQHIVHIDCDAFYAAVEEIDRPELKNVPMAVGLGVLTTCNYEARKFGCRSAMAGFVAKKLCPQLICLPLNLDKYAAKAKEVRAILAEYDANFESSSIDEAYMNITPYCRIHQMDPDSVMEKMRREVHERCKVTVSAGIAPNAKLAKICSNKNKPNGQYRLASERGAVMAFMKDLPVRKVNGVGRVLERELDAIGIKTCGDIYEYRGYILRLFGEKTFHFLLQTYLGLGRTDIHPAEDYERKSVGTESTFHDMSSKTELREKLRQTAEELEKDLRRAQVKGRTVCLKIKLHTYELLTRQVQPPRAVCQADDLYSYSLPLLAKLEREIPDMKIRLMGLRCTHLISTKKSDRDFFKQCRGVHQTPTAKTSPNANVSNTPDANANANANDDGEWKVWPDEEFEEAARPEWRDEMEQMKRLSQEQQEQEQERQQQGAQEQPKNEFWDCPVCGFPQPASADQDEMNRHIDLCLSRQTIRDAVAAESQSQSQSQSQPQPQPQLPAFGSSNNNTITTTGTSSKKKPNKRKGGSLSSGGMIDAGPRQKRLFFA